MACELLNLKSQAFMSAHIARLGEILEFLRGGVASNFWGLGCPSWCGAPSWTALCLAFGAGIATGLLLALLVLFAGLYLLGFLRLPVTAVTRPSFLRPEGRHPRLQGYLHGL